MVSKVKQYPDTSLENILWEWEENRFFNYLIMKKTLSQLIQWSCEHPFYLFLLWSFGLAFEYFIFGHYSFIRIQEDADCALNGRLLLSFNLTSLKFGYWNPTQLSGNDTILGSHIFDLDSLPFVFLPGWLAYGLVMWLQRFIAGYFTFRLLKETLNIDAISALYAGLAYSLYANFPQTGPPLGFPLFYGLVIPGISFFIWALARLNEHKKSSYLLAFGIGVIFSITTNVGFGIFILPVIFFWFLFVKPRLTLKFWFLVLIFIIGFLVFESPILWAMSLNAPLSHRAYWNLAEPAGPELMKGLFAKDLILLGISVLGLVASRGRFRPLVAFVVAILCSLVFVIIIYPFFSNYIHPHLGFLRGFQFDRIYLVYPYLTIMAAAIGISCLRERQFEFVKKTTVYYNVSLYKAVLVVAIGMVCFQALSMKITIPRMKNGSNYTTLFQNPAVRELAEANKMSPPFRVVTVRDKHNYPPNLFPAAVAAQGLETADGYVGAYFRRYQEYWEQVIWRLLESEPNHGEFSSWGSRVYIFKGVYDLKLLSLANVRFILADKPLDDKNLILLPYGSSNRDEQIAWLIRQEQNKLQAILESYRFPVYPTFVYENPQVFPRFFLAENVRLFEESKQVLASLRNADCADLRSTAYVKQSDVAFLSFGKLGSKEGRVELQRYTSDRIVLKVSNPQNSILIITNNFSPYWKATVNGIKTGVFPVDHTFQGIYLRSGEHKVILEYSPPYAIRLGL